MATNGAEPVSLDDRIDDETSQVLTTDPFVDSATFDLRLTGPTTPGQTLDHPFAQTDGDGVARGGDGRWDRGAFEFVE